MTLLDQLYWNGSIVFESVSVHQWSMLYSANQISKVFIACKRSKQQEGQATHMYTYENWISVAMATTFHVSIGNQEAQATSQLWSESAASQWTQLEIPPNHTRALGRCLDSFTCLYQCSLLGSGISALNLLVFVFACATHLHVWVTLHSTWSSHMELTFCHVWRNFEHIMYNTQTRNKCLRTS